MIKRLQLVHGHAFHIRLIPDHRPAITVGDVGARHGVLVKHRERVVFAHLELVSDHGKFLVEVFLLDEGIHHAVGFHVERPLQVFIGGLECFEIIGAVEVGGSVRPAAVLGKLLHDIQMVSAALEYHVLQQVGHAAFAGAFLPRADQVSDIDGDGGFGRIGEHQEMQSVVETVLGDAFDGSYLLYAAGQVLSGAQHWREEKCGGRNEAKQCFLHVHIP